MEKNRVFSYYWGIDEKEENVTSIRMYGLSESNKNMCIIINDFRPWVYIQLPVEINWDNTKVRKIYDKIDQLLGEHKPIKVDFRLKHRLYFAHLNPDGSRKVFPYIYCEFSSKNDVQVLYYRLKRPLSISGIGPLTLKIHESDADPILQLTVTRDISTAGWIEFVGKKVPKEDQVSLCDLEYKVSSKMLKKYDKELLAKPKIMGFDIEVNSCNPSAMPKAENPGDKIFQISCVFAREGEPPEKYKPYLLSLGQPDPKLVGENAIVQAFRTESDLLVGFTNLIRKENPNICVGYNILGFDIPYMIARAKSDCTSFCIGEFDKMGFHKYNHAKERVIKWSSSAYKNQEFQFLDAEGRLFVDLLPLIKRDFKMDNYRLKTVSEYFLKDDTKDPLSVKGIFKCYRIGTKKELDGTYSKKAIQAISKVAKYCVKDSALVVKLMDTLKSWTGLCEMAKTVGTTIFSLYTQGQQIKVYSQVYRFCFVENTQVSCVHGNIPIQNLVKYDNDVLSWDNNNDNLIFSRKTNFFNNGVQECIELEFEDGRKIVCTPDHLFASDNGDWVKASDLNLNSRLKIGPILPSLEIDTDEMVFSRVLGYVLTDGHINEKDCLVFIGNLLDAKIFVSDISKLCSIEQKIRKTKNQNCWSVRIPKVLASKIRNVIGVVCGNRTDNDNTSLPTNLLSWNKNELKEFLGGIFGGDGWCPSYNKKLNCFTAIGLTQTRKKEDCLKRFMDTIIKCLQIFDIESKYSVKIKNKKFAGILILQGDNLYKFVENIGYRYCFHKTLRASVVYIYYKIRDKALENKQKLFDDIVKLKSDGLTTTKSYAIAIKNNEMFEYMPVLRSFMRYMNNNRIGKDNMQVSIGKFPKAKEFIKIIGAENVFKDGKKNEHTYAMTKDQITIPVFSLKLIGRKNIGSRNVFDIEVDNTHSFLANGIVVHNCHANNMVVEKDGYPTKDNERYVGAHVFPPVPGIYDRVLPFDFASLII